MKKILQVGMTDIYGGTEAYLINQYRLLDKTRFQYDFISMLEENNSICFEDELRLKSEVINLPFTRTKRVIKSYYVWLKWMRNNAKRYDGIVYNINGLNVAFPVLAYKLFGNGKVIVHSHNSGEMDGKDNPIIKFIRMINRFIINQITDIRLACSKRAGEYIFNKKFEIIRNGIDVKKYRYSKFARKRLRIEYGVENKFIIGHVGRFSFQKNQEKLIEIISNIKNAGIEVLLFLIGDRKGNEEFAKKIEELIKKNQLVDYVIIENPKTNIEDYYSMFDVFILPSRFEGLPLVGVEAQAAGLPCYFSDKITKEISITRNAHFIELDKNSAEWANIIIKENYNKDLTDRELFYQEVGDAGYSIQEQIEKIQKIYANI